MSGEKVAQAVVTACGRLFRIVCGFRIRVG